MKITITFIALFLAGLMYLTWLDAGCELGGVMTWQGKACAETLTSY